MKKNNKNTENVKKGEPKSLDDYIQLYTHIVRELSEKLKDKKDIINDILYHKTDLYKTLEFRKHFEHLKNHKKLY